MAKQSKRQQARAQKQQAKLTQGKPTRSRYAEKGGPYQYGVDPDQAYRQRVRGF